MQIFKTDLHLLSIVTCCRLNLLLPVFLCMCSLSLQSTWSHMNTPGHLAMRFSRLLCHVIEGHTTTYAAFCGSMCETCSNNCLTGIVSTLYSYLCDIVLTFYL